jgi:sterol desaturase/sphingolipid hydroxylase (fatty acid hydroxylase superfamily)
MVVAVTAFFCSGWLLGVVLEYILHIVMHRASLRFHLHHHHDFFSLEARDVALKDLSPRLNVLFLLGLLALASPLMLRFGVMPVLVVWGGVVWHILIVYEACHALIHYDVLIPGFIKRSRPYIWWRACHIQHHRHSPAGNFCVTCPVLDWIFGTYVRPQS